MTVLQDPLCLSGDPPFYSLESLICMDAPGPRPSPVRVPPIKYKLRESADPVTHLFFSLLYHPELSLPLE